MVIIHVVEELSILDVEEAIPGSFLEALIQFGAGPMVAPMFVFSMGAGLKFSTHQKPKHLISRGFRILLLALGLNLWRDVIPRLLAAFVTGNPLDMADLRYQMFNIDILHFAGLSLILVGLMKKARITVAMAFPLAVIMQIIGNRLSLYYQPENIAELICSYFFYTGDLSCFPLFDWFIYLAFGILAGEMILENINDTNRFYKICLFGGLSLMAGFVNACTRYDIEILNFYSLYQDAYYRQTFLHFIFTALVIAIEIAIAHYIMNRSAKLDAFAKFCGGNLNTIYLFQWMIIGWLTSFNDILNLQPDLIMSIIMGISIALLCILLVKILPPIRLASGLYKDSD